MRDPELVARAQRAASRLEAAWERWRAAQGLGDTPAQPVVGYVGYALKEPWGQPRAVIGFSADEAERLAEHLEHGLPAVPQQASPVQQWSGTPSAPPAAKSTAKDKTGEPQPAAETKAELTADRSLPAFNKFSGTPQRPARN